MPLIHNSGYKPPFLFMNGHVQSTYPTLYRQIKFDYDERVRITTPDDDFLDLGLSHTGSSRLAIISHGLEGNSERAYVLGMVKALKTENINALVWNQRGCGGEPNLKLRFPNNGTTDDLNTVISYAISKKKYDEIYLIGFSLGGNITLAYLGGLGGFNIPAELKCSIVFSVPCNLADAEYQLARFSRRIYMNRFLRMLHEKIKIKSEMFPAEISEKDYEDIKNFRQFDNRYTAPIHGYKDAEDYWEKCSSGNYLSDIKSPVLLINAKNDPFLGKDCYPVKQAEESRYVFLEMPSSGGHAGFIEFNSDNMYWSEKRALEFIKQYK